MSESNLAARSDGLEGQVSGARVIAQALKTQDVNYMFGIVGIPVTEIALAAQEVGIRYIGMRNEQAVEACRLYSKFSARPSSIEAIPSIIEKVQCLLCRHTCRFREPPGAAYAHAEESIRKLVEQCKLPFLPTPMGKGVIRDNHPNCVAAARS
ncbi:hypothetical protein Celaphus_00012772, partial [Cervus elaphus hippelaphus]